MSRNFTCVLIFVKKNIFRYFSLYFYLALSKEKLNIKLEIYFMYWQISIIYLKRYIELGLVRINNFLVCLFITLVCLLFKTLLRMRLLTKRNNVVKVIALIKWLTEMIAFPNRFPRSSCNFFNAQHVRLDRIHAFTSLFLLCYKWFIIYWERNWWRNSNFEENSSSKLLLLIYTECMV